MLPDFIGKQVAASATRRGFVFIDELGLACRVDEEYFDLFRETTHPMGKNTRTGIERIFRMVAFLQNETKNGGKVNCTDLQNEFEVDRATVLRDLRFIQDRLEMDVEWDASARSYVVNSNSQFLPPMELEDRDYLVLAFFQQCLAPFSGSELGRHMLSSFERMFGILTGTKSWNNWTINVLFRFAEKPPTGSSGATEVRELKLFNLLHRAIRDRRVVEFQYKSPANSSPKSKSIEPHLMAMNHGRWYFYGTDTRTRKLTPFAFARASVMKITPQKFMEEPVQHPRELLQHSFGSVLGTGPAFDVVLEFESKAAQRVKETVWHPQQKVRELPGGRLRLVLPLNSTLEVAPWILSWGPYVKVVEPVELRESIADFARRMAENYSA
jgi:predicted DNA-binding transcriptional regulator YafY